MDTSRREIDEKLLRSLAEQLKLPLTRIARQSELADIADITSIHTSAASALRLIEGFLLQSHMHGQNQLQLEPVSLKAMLYDIGQELTPLTRQTGKQLNISQKGRWGQVMANPSALKTALLLLGHAAIASSEDSDNDTILLWAHKYGNSVQAGIFSDNNLTSEALTQGRDLYGKAKQAVPSALGTAAAEIYLADSLISSMALELSVSKQGGLTGLVTNLLPSKQMALIA